MKDLCDLNFKKASYITTEIILLEFFCKWCVYNGLTQTQSNVWPARPGSLWNNNSISISISDTGLLEELCWFILIGGGQLAKCIYNTHERRNKSVTGSGGAFRGVWSMGIILAGWSLCVALRGSHKAMTEVPALRGTLTGFTAEMDHLTPLTLIQSQ